MAMEPEACIAPPEGNGEPLEEVSGGRGRFHGASTYNVVRTHTRAYAYAPAYRLRRLHSALAGVLALAGYASPDNITSSRGVKHRQGPGFLRRLLA